jgi:prevent-host-death family protein
MKKQSATVSKRPRRTLSARVQELATVPGLGKTIAVRAAKAQLSALLDWVAEGHEVVVTSGGLPKARIIPAVAGERRKVFLGTAEHLKRMPKWDGGMTAEEIVREDRDSKGW